MINQKFIVGLVFALVILSGAVWYLASGRRPDRPVKSSGIENHAMVTVVDKLNLYAVAIPKDWKITESVGSRGVSLSNIHMESPDFKGHSRDLTSGPFTGVYYDTGASLAIQAMTLKGEAPTGTGVISKRNMEVDGVSGIYSVFQEPSTMQGQLLEVDLSHGGNSYSLRMGYNPTTYPQGEGIFLGIVNSFKFLQ